MKIIWEMLVTLGVALVAFFLLQITIQSSIVVGSSMLPNLEHGQRILVSKVSYKFHEPERGDVVVFVPPTGGTSEYIKRVIALPGDTIEIKKDTVYVNDKPLEEPYIASAPHYSFDKIEIPPDNYFVLGDNRNNSNDSHKGWTTPRKNIVGKAWLSIWPPEDWGVAPNRDLSEQLAASTN